MKILKSLAIAVLCLITGHLSAQVTLGIKGSYVKAWEEYGDVALPDDAEIDIEGVNVSALIYYRITPLLSVGIEPGFIQKGAACEPGFIIFEGDAKLRLNYIDLPVMIMYDTPKVANVLSGYCKMGGYLSKVISAHRDIEDVWNPDSFIRTKLEIGEEFGIRSMDHGLLGSVGIQCDLGANQFFVETTYSHGFKSVDPENRSENRTLQLGVGYTVTL